MSDYDDFIGKLLEGLKELATNTFQDHVETAKNDAEAFIEKSKDDLQRWTKLLAQGDLTEEDFSYLIQAKKAVAEMHGLRQAGLTLIKVEKFRKGVIDLVIDTAFDVFL